MKQITVLSGKGGVGKSSITASLAIALSKGKKIICADCDVDASNLALVFGLEEKDMQQWKGLATNEKAFLLPEKCTGCGACVGSCHFNAIGWDEEKKQPVFDKYGCEGCGVCPMVCPSDAIELRQVENAKIGFGKTKYGFDVVSAQLKMGESGSGKVVAEVKKLAAERSKKETEILLIDAAAGIGCPVIASISGSNYAVAVTEPTPSGLSDLKRALGIVGHFGVPCGIIINKYDLNPSFSKKIESFAEKSGIDVLAKIAYDKAFTDALVNLVPIVVHKKEYTAVFEKLAENILERTSLGKM